MKDWKKVKLGSLLTESKIVSENPDTDKRLRVRLNMLGVEKRPKTNDKEGATKYYIRKAGQFIYGKQNLHKGAFGIIPEELDGFESSSDIPAFNLHESCYAEWIYYFFKKGDFYRNLEKLAKGVGSKRIQPTQIFDLDIYLPSKVEQREILEKIYELEQKHKVILSEIESRESWLFDLRQSITDEAFKGKLTEDWRKENSNIEPAQKILNRIKEVKEKLVLQKIITKEKPVAPIIPKEIPYAISTNWEWCKMQDIGIIERGKSKHRPRNDAKLFTSKGGYPFIQTGDVSNAKFTQGVIRKHNKEYSEFGLQQSRLWPSGTLCITIAANIAETGFLDYSACFPDSVVGFTDLINSSILPFYTKYFIDISKNDLVKYAPGTAQKNINLNILKELMLPLPPLLEQKQIVEKINKMMLFYSSMIEENRNIREDSAKILSTLLIKFLGDEKNEFLNIKREKKNSINYLREKKYDSKTTLMELIDLLKKHGKLHAEDLWKMSKYFDNKNIGDSIDKFYAELKKKIEVDKTVKEVENEKGYLELI